MKKRQKAALIEASRKRKENKEELVKMEANMLEQLDREYEEKVAALMKEKQEKTFDIAEKVKVKREMQVRVDQKALEELEKEHKTEQMELMEEMWRQADEENDKDDETLLITSSDEEEEKEKSNKIEKENDKSEIGLYSLLNSNRATTGTDKGDESENVKKVCESNILGRNVEDRRIIRSDNYQVEKEVRMECEDAIIKPILARYGLIGWKNHQFWTYS